LIERHLRELTAKPNIRKILELPIRVAEVLIKTAPESLGKNGPSKDSLLICTAIGIAGWAAWTAADRIRDGENAVRGISCDDLYVFSILRPIIDELIGKLSLPAIYLKRLKHIIGMMEYANSSHCSMGVREQSSWKSMGAAIPLLALMMRLNASDKDIASCERLFYYLILARQLSDDALDWKEDASGIGNGGKGKINDHNNDTLVVKWIEEAFEERVKYQVAREMLKTSRQAVKMARDISCFTNTEFLEELPRYYEEMAERILQKQPISSSSAHPWPPSYKHNNRKH